MSSSLDITKEDCRRILRRLELETFGSIVSTFRAQGDLSKDKKKLLQDLATALKIPSERQKAEIRRAVNDEKLNTVAQSLTGADSETSWALEGRRIVPVYQRWIAPTSFSLLADSVANMAERHPHFVAPVSLERRPEIIEDKYLKEDLERTALHPGSSKPSFHRTKSNTYTSRGSHPSNAPVEQAKHSNDLAHEGITNKPLKRPRRESLEFTAISSPKVHVVAKSSTSPQTGSPAVVRVSVPKLAAPVSSSTPQPVSSSKSMASTRQLAPATPTTAGRIRTRGPVITPRPSVSIISSTPSRPRFSAPGTPTTTPRQRLPQKAGEKLLGIQTPTQRHIRPIYVQQTIAPSSQQVVVRSTSAETTVKNVTLTLSSPLVKTPISVANTTTVQVLQRPLLAGAGVNLVSTQQTIPVNKLIQASANSAILKNSGGKPNVIMISKGHPLTKAFVAQQNKDFLKSCKPVSVAPRTPLKQNSESEQRIAPSSTTSNVFVLDLRSESLSEPALITNILQSSAVIGVEAENMQVAHEVTSTQEVSTSEVHISGDDITTVSSEVVIENTPLTSEIVSASSDRSSTPAKAMSLDEALSILGQEKNPGARELFHCLAEGTGNVEVADQTGYQKGVHNGNHTDIEITETPFIESECSAGDEKVSLITSSNEVQKVDIFSTALASADIPMDNLDCVYMEEAIEEADAT